MKALVVALVLAARLARADVPWADGVSVEQQARANKLFAEGNQLFAEQAHAPALAKYEAAIAIWDHPMIRYNMAVTLIRLDRILEAADNLERALRFGEKPFPPTLFLEAQDYRKLIAARVGSIEASCKQAGVKISLDSKRWFDCPSSRHARVLAGEHLVVGEREGLMTASRRMFVDGGAAASTSIELDPVSYVPPKWYQHWYVIAAVGVVAAGAAGTTIYLSTRQAGDRVPVTIVPK